MIKEWKYLGVASWNDWKYMRSRTVDKKGWPVLMEIQTSLYCYHRSTYFIVYNRLWYLPMMQAARYNLEVTTPKMLICRYIVFTFACLCLIDRTLTLWSDSAFKLVSVLSPRRRRSALSVTVTRRRFYEPSESNIPSKHEAFSTVVLTLDQHRRRWAGIKTTLAEFLVFAEFVLCPGCHCRATLASQQQIGRVLSMGSRIFPRNAVPVTHTVLV